MAKISRECGGISAYFLIFLWITRVLSANDYHVYESTDTAPHHRSEYSIHLDLLPNHIAAEDVHRLQKRDSFSLSQMHQVKSDGRDLPPASIPAVGNVSTAEETTTALPPTKSKSSKLSKPTTSNSTKVIVKQQDIYSKHLLGVNGTGQRNDILSSNVSSTNNTTKPAVLTLPTPPTNRNITIPLIHSNNSSNVTQSNVTSGTAAETRSSSSSNGQNQTTSSRAAEEDVDIEKIVDENDEFINKTLLEHNITMSKEDYHIYYNSTLLVDPEKAQNYYWVDLDNRSEVVMHDLLSKSHRRAATVKLSFDFPFYGHLIKNVTIATGGFLYTGDYVHSWLAATQYVAPLMANFDTSLSNDSCIRYHDNGTAFTVEWVKVSLQDKPDEGEFTFQVTLYDSGDIVFVYKNVPLFIKNIGDDHHPVKVGLSDAYIIDRTIFFVRRKTIYEYHRVNFFKEDIKNWTVIHLKALPTCLEHKDCSSCLLNPIPSFKCVWCPSMSRCSNGIDRRRQEWLMRGCDKLQISNESQCGLEVNYEDHDHGTYDDNNHNNNKNTTTYTHDSSDVIGGGGHDTFDGNHNNMDGNNNGGDASRIYDNNNKNDGSVIHGQDQSVGRMGVSGVLAILFLIMMVCLVVSWVVYAYRNPHTPSGQILIKYRPNQWRLRRGEARYTAATIHM